MARKRWCNKLLHRVFNEHSVFQQVSNLTRPTGSRSSGATWSTLSSCTELVSCSFVASAYSILALDTAGRLDRELATLASYVDDLRDLIRSDSRGALLVHAVARVIATAQDLRTQALEGALELVADPVEIHEHALRARISILVRGLYAIKQGEAAVPAAAFASRFCSLRDFNRYLIDRVAHLHERWLEQRRAEQSLDATARRVLAHAALDDAEIAFERLGRDADLESFLRAGSASASESVATACREIAASLGMTIGRDRDASRPKRPVGNTSEQDTAGEAQP